MSGVRVLVGTRKGAFTLTSDEKRRDWQVDGPHFPGWEVYHVAGSPADLLGLAAFALLPPAAALDLLVIVLLAINPGMRLPDALAGFTSEVTFFLIGVAAIGTAVEASGLAQRGRVLRPDGR